MKRYMTMFLLLFTLSASAVSAADQITWLTLKDGLPRAKAENKPMVVDFFFGKGCVRCEKLQKEVYENPAIAKKIMDDFIPIRVDLTKALTSDEERLGEKFDYKKDCLLIFLDFDSNLVPDKAGKRLCFIDTVDPEEFIGYLDHVRKTYLKATGGGGKI